MIPDFSGGALAGVLFGILLCSFALVAQWIEQRIPVPRAGGSNPLECGGAKFASICKFIMVFEGKFRAKKTSAFQDGFCRFVRA